MTQRDSKLPSLFPRKHYLDIVDDDWITDTLSDDGNVSGLTKLQKFIIDPYYEIEVPPALDVGPNGDESPTGEPPMWTADEKVDRWNDLGLDQWVKDTA
ncbi:hypothetical protein PHPALM_10227 [Phytophthora palmivora]|uniref:Uncharacterized protein n=1 Tax=Phytophthora palmivora TaxID=4796 RepID=A0A2P4Y5A7_9STRA|nr:hypothetical protein PHPALM_10227 [Phytophthora palmivora]